MELGDDGSVTAIVGTKMRYRVKELQANDRFFAPDLQEWVTVKSTQRMRGTNLVVVSLVEYEGAYDYQGEIEVEAVRK